MHWEEKHMKSTFGKNIKVEIFGGSHEKQIGVTIEGLPPDPRIDSEELQKFLDRRAPGNSPFATSRREPDKIALLKSEPLTFVIQNTDVRESDYAEFSKIPRPGHADFTAREKYGDKLNMSGGGPFSGRMTAPLCIAGGIAKQILAQVDIEIGAHLFSIRETYDRPFDPVSVTAGELRKLQTMDFPVLDESAGEKMKEEIISAASENDSLGGIIEAAVTGLPTGIGGPMYDGLESCLAQIIFGIPAAKGLEFGTGFASSILKGSENNDPFVIEECKESSLTGEKKVKTLTNHCGGVLGGITDGMPLVLRAAFKPTPSIGTTQDSVNLETMEPAKLEIVGRHDPCVAVRAVPVIEAAVAIGILDLMMEEE